MRWFSWFAVLFALSGTVIGTNFGNAPLRAAERPGGNAAPPGLDVDPRPLPPAITAYLGGLEALAAARWDAAATAFAEAVDADPDEAAYHRSRGVALTLAEKLSDAIPELQRASKLQPADKETRIWLAAATNMIGDSYHAREIYAPHTNDSYETFIGQMRISYGLAAELQKRGQATPRDLAQREAAKQKFPQAGAWYASRMKETPSLTRYLFVRAKQRVQRGQFALALDDLDYVRRRYPKDMAVLYYHAVCLTATGDAATARQEITEVLTACTNFGLGYSARALASAKLGDARRARNDVAVAATLLPRDAERVGALVEKELAALKADAPAGQPHDLRKALALAAHAGNVPFAKLVEQAVALHKAVMVRRLQEDEVYQTRLKAHEDAVRSNPGNPDTLVALADFLTREAQARYERHVVGGPFRLLRQEVPRDPEGEFARAETLADQALALNPQHAPALVAKARVRFAFHQFRDADELLQRALKIHEDVPDGLELYARVITVGAAQAEASAKNLETPQSGRSYGHNVTVYWTRYPSPAELRAAEEFRAIARQRLDRARQIFEKAVQLRPKDGAGYYDLALWRLQQQDLPGAREALQKAVQLTPDHIRARQALIKVYGDLGMKQEAYQEESILITQTEGGVGVLLAQAAKQMERTAWKTAENILNRAAQADPVDARVPAYQGIIRLADKQPAEALALWRMGLALEEARLQPLGITSKQESLGSRNPDEMALLMVLRLRVAALQLQGGRLAEALELAQNNLALEKRLAVTDRLRDLPTTILPDVDPKPLERPEPENALSLLAWSHYYAGQALKGLKRRDEAAQQFQAAHAAGRSLTVGRGTRALNEPRNRAGLALGWILLERGEVSAADRLMREVDTTVKHSGSQELAAQKRELQQAIWKATRTGAGSGRP